MDREQKLSEIRQECIKLIHGCELEEALEKESKNEGLYNDDGIQIKSILPITLARLLSAIKKKCDGYDEMLFDLHAGVLVLDYDGKVDNIKHIYLEIDVNGREATLEDQTDETVDALWDLLCKET